MNCVTSLTPAQASAFDKFSKLRVGALFMKQGTGKTRTAIELCQYNQPDAVIWLAPYSTIDTINQQFSQWGQPSPNVRVVGYETLSSSDNTYLDLLAFVDSHRNVMVVADESIFIKNADAKRSQRANVIRARCVWALVLNGTPVTRDLFDLKRQMDFLSPRIVNMSDEQFRATYYKKIVYRKQGQDQHTFYKEFEPNVDHLRSLVAPYVFEADLAFDDSRTGESWVVEESDEVTEREYKSRKAATLVEYRTCGGSGILSALSGLNRVANTSPTRLAAIRDQVQGRRVLVFSHYLHEVRELASSGGFVITGQTTAEERTRILADFEASDQPLFMTVGTGAFGLNLQTCSEVHFSSIGFDWGRLQQAKARIRRLGQTEALTYVHHQSEFGISDMIRQNLDRKAWLDDIVRREFDLEAAL